MNGCISICFAMFSKGDKFCIFMFAYVDNEGFPPKWGRLIKERIYSTGANSFLHDMTRIYMGGNIKMTELLPLKVNTFT